MNEIERLARELHGVNWTYEDWDLLDEDDKTQWLDLARHVRRLVLEAKIIGAMTIMEPVTIGGMVVVGVEQDPRSVLRAWKNELDKLRADHGGQEDGNINKNDI